MWTPASVKALMETFGVFDVVNPLTTKGFPIDELNRLALDKVKSMSIIRAPTAGKALSKYI